MSLSLEKKRALVDIKKAKYFQNIKNIISPQVSVVFSDYIKPDDLNIFNGIMCNILYNLFIEFRTMKENQKEEFEKRWKQTAISIKSKQDLSKILKRKKKEEEDKYIKDLADLAVIMAIDKNITELEPEINNEKEIKNKQMEEYKEFLTTYEDSEQTNYSNEYMQYIICEFKRMQYFEKYEIIKSLKNGPGSIQITQFYNSITIYKCLHNNELDYFKYLKYINDIKNKVI